MPPSVYLLLQPLLRKGKLRVGKDAHFAHVQTFEFVSLA